jgi:hypothetical protein
MLQYVLKFVGGSVVVVSDPCRVATFSVIGSCFYSRVQGFRQYEVRYRACLNVTWLHQVLHISSSS